ncbi:GNAT family N-acetyltransferase [Limosilactobacillus avium]|uniref:GNAT family N-acetyltransferase n=1 Tax=Limosilactobacillus avium TaxID=2991831 RepID=UPI0024B9F4A1|nr:GNAT family N-acetyltransferase [Limosilactobacillus avium]
MIRKMNSSDLDTVMQIWFDGNCDAHSSIPRSYWEKQRPAVRAAIKRAEVYCFIDGTGIVRGFIGLTGDYIAGLFVSAGFRNCGIGHQLLNFAKKGHDQLELAAYRQNQQAIKFYQHNDFVITRQTSAELRMAWSINK